jgi:hypothetical protein
MAKVLELHATAANLGTMGVNRALGGSEEADAHLSKPFYGLMRRQQAAKYERQTRSAMPPHAKPIFSSKQSKTRRATTSSAPYTKRQRETETKSVGVAAASQASASAPPPNPVMPVYVAIGEGETLPGLPKGILEAQNVPDWLKYASSACEIFRYPKLFVTKEPSGFIVKVSSKDRIHMRLMYQDGDRFVPLDDVMTVTSSSEVRMTSVYIVRPEVSMTFEELREHIRRHQSLGYLQGVEFTLVDYAKGRWIQLSEFDDEQHAEMWGIVVSRKDVAVIWLRICNGDNPREMAEINVRKDTIPVVVLKESDKSLLEWVKAGCDWHAWPAVSACSSALTLDEETSVVRVQGAFCTSMSARVLDDSYGQGCS